MTIQYPNINVDVQWPRYNVDVLPAQLKNTHRILLKYIHALYSCDVALNFNLYFKQLYSDTEYMYQGTMPANQTYFKQKLPIGMLCREFRFEIIGYQVTVCTIIEAGVLWLPKYIGQR